MLDTLVPVISIVHSSAVAVPPLSLITCLITISVASSVFVNVHVTTSPTLRSIGDTVSTLSHDDVLSVQDAAESMNPGGKNVGKIALRSSLTEYIGSGMRTIWPDSFMSVPVATSSTSFCTNTGPSLITNLNSRSSLTGDVVFFIMMIFASPAFTIVHSTASPGASVTVPPRDVGHPSPVIETNA